MQFTSDISPRKLEQECAEIVELLEWGEEALILAAFNFKKLRRYGLKGWAIESHTPHFY